MYNGDRGSAVGRTEHGPCGLRSGGRPEEVHQCQGVDQLPVLQRGTTMLYGPRQLSRCPFPRALEKLSYILIPLSSNERLFS